MSFLPVEENDHLPLILTVTNPDLSLHDEMEALEIEKWGLRGSILRARVPMKSIIALANKDWVRLIETPDIRLDDVGFDRGGIQTSEGLAKTNAREYHQAGFSGQGVKIGVIDTEFGNLAQALASGEVPTPLQQYDCNESGCTPVVTVEKAGEDNHGTACFEIIADFAPDATYYLVDLTNGSLMEAVQTLTAQGVHVISMSLGFNPSAGPLDGRDRFNLNNAMKEAWDNGAVFVKSAGNYKQKAYSATFTGADDNFHDFYTLSTPLFTYREESMEFTVTRSSNFYLVWDEWNPVDVNNTTAMDEYTLHITDEDAGTTTAHTATTDFPIIGVALSPGSYSFQVERTNAHGAPKDFRVMIWTGGSLTRTNAPSITPPVESPHGIAVGAVSAGGAFFGFGADNQEPYSSEGPGANGAVKPDVASYANVSTDSYGTRGFNGTSSATPHVAGLTAIVLSMDSQPRGNMVADFVNPTKPGDGYFQTHANPRGNGSPNNQYGWGIARLPLLGDPMVTVQQPTGVTQANVRAGLNRERINIEVAVTSQVGDFIGGLTSNAFNITVNGQAAVVNSTLQLDTHYILNIDVPNLSTGEYTLAATVEVNGRDGSGNQANAVRYADATSLNVDAMLVLDRSGSMSGTAIQAARDAASLFVDLMSIGDQVGVASYSGSSRIDFPLTEIQAPGPPVPPVFADDMESGGSQWSAGTPWALTDTAAASGSYSWTDSPNGNYDNSVEAILAITDAIDLTGLSNPTLSFQTIYFLENGWDYGLVEVSTNGGLSWQNLTFLTGTQSTWTELQFNLSNFAGLNILLRFRLITDGSFTYDGWYIDDVLVAADEVQSDVQSQARAAIANISSGGSTSIGAGLQDALDQHQTRGNPDHPWTTVLMTDGQENSSPFVSSVLPGILNTKTKVYTIGLGSSIDEALLRSVADQTDGQYFNAATAADLQEIYNTISGEVLDRETLLTRPVALTQGEVSQSNFYIDNSTREMVSSITWSIQGDDFTLELISPSGTTIDQNTTDPDVTYLSGDTYASYRITDPEPGLWTMVVTGVSVTGRMLDPVFDKAWALNDRSILEDLAESTLARLAEPNRGPVSTTVNLQVQAETDLEMQTILDKDGYAQGETIRASVFMGDNGDTPVLQSVWAQVTYPDDTTSPFGLFRDDGLDGDSVAGDGNFTGYFSGTDQIGNYVVQINAQGVTAGLESFERFNTVSTVITVGADSDFDGMPNDWETSFSLPDEPGLDPFFNDAGLDPDEDGLTNGDEFDRGTHPFLADTDRDGLRDGEEVNTTGTDPSADDTDGGGESDGDEVALGRNPLDPADDVPCPLSLNLPHVVRLGLQPLEVQAEFTCARVGMSLAWIDEGTNTVIAEDINPLTITNQFDRATLITAELSDPVIGDFAEASVLILIPTPAYLDFNRDGCNTPADLIAASSTWTSERSDDPDRDGVVTVLDLLYLNIDQADPCTNR
ncbi:MAG: VWA domain-containing protein [Acidobacteriota bacterium]|nr:VWA domain-containing protein [Acidobacteriota bacterium]